MIRCHLSRCRNGAGEEAEMFVEILSQVLHRRMATEILEDATEALWTADQHWGWCGQNCPCCRTQHQEALGRCAACEAADRAAVIVTKIAVYLVENQSTRIVMASLGEKLGLHNRPLPSSVVKEIAEMLPEIRGTVPAAAGLASLGLKGGGGDLLTASGD